MFKKFLKLLKEFFDYDGLYSIDGLYFGGGEQKEEEPPQDEPLDCTGFYLSNTETNYGKSHFHRYK